VSSRLTSHPARDSDPIWSPDGKEIAFVSDRDGRYAIYRKAVDGSNPETPIGTIALGNNVVPSDWSADGKYVLYSLTHLGMWASFAMPVAGDRQPIRLLPEATGPSSVRLSPDGRWIAYTSFDTGITEVYVQPFLAAGDRKQISTGGGTHARWTMNGRELVYWAVPQGIHAVSFEPAGSTFRLGPRRVLLASPVLNLIDARPHYDVTRDGKRLLVRQPAGPQQAGLNVILNWTSKLK
jgi:Tol biopolymer transport system component